MAWRIHLQEPPKDYGYIAHIYEHLENVKDSEKEEIEKERKSVMERIQHLKGRYSDEDGLRFESQGDSQGDSRATI
jgi:hypothetical protein